MMPSHKWNWLVKPTRIHARATKWHAGEQLSHTDTMSTKIDELFATLAALLADQTRDLALAMAEIDSVTAERDKARLHLASLQSCLNSAAKSVRESEIAANNARQSLRAAEQDLAETESVNSDLRTVNARLVADLAAAIERLNHAESILMQ